jgi:hypothetical protein
VKLSRAEFDARGRAREGCHAQWICHARAELLKRPSGEVAAGPSHPRFRRPRPHPFDDRNQLAPGACLFGALSHAPLGGPRANVDKSWHVSDHRRRRTPRSTQAACGQKCPPARLGKWPETHGLGGGVSCPRPGVLSASGKRPPGHTPGRLVLGTRTPGRPLGGKDQGECGFPDALERRLWLLGCCMRPGTRTGGIILSRRRCLPLRH